MIRQKKFWFIRHAESEGNAGMPTASAGDIPITSRGKQQAEHIANHLTSPPDLFVLSPYSRTAQTAAPALIKFPETPVETWAIQEYTYLPAELHRNTTTTQRNEPAIRYFRKADPDLVLGLGAESFNQLIGRVDGTFEKLVQSSLESIYLFSHGWFIRSLLWRLVYFSTFENDVDLSDLAEKMPDLGFSFKLFSRFGKTIRGKPMNHFLFYSAVVKIPNGAIVKFSFDTKTERIHFDGVEISHIPPELRGSHLTNR